MTSLTELFVTLSLWHWKNLMVKFLHKTLTSHFFLRATLSNILSDLFSLEYWTFEILVFLAGVMPNSEVTTSLIAIWYFASLLLFFSCYILIQFAFYLDLRLMSSFFDFFFSVYTKSIAYYAIYGFSVAARLGRQQTCILSNFIFIFNMASLFSVSSERIKLFTSMTPLLLVLDCFYGVLSG